tara:strand:+ start:234 stop:1055 length:822 start_codon:yes stop_codon:yes gene_type:complete
MLLVSTLAVFVSAVSVENVQVDVLNPGEEGRIVVDIENVFNRDVEDVSLEINVAGLPFTTVGTSQLSVDEIRDGDDERFAFKIKSSNDIELGDYQIPYTLKYILSNNEVIRSGSFGVRVTADSEIEFGVETERAVMGEQGKIEFKIINKGFGDIKFTDVKIFPDGYSLISEQQVYVGNVDSDDFESVNFDVIFNSKNPKVKILVEYKDFENNLIRDNLEFPINIYSREKAVELGIIEENKTQLYIGIVVGILIIWYVFRKFGKRRRLKKSKNN